MPLRLSGGTLFSTLTIMLPHVSCFSFCYLLSFVLLEFFFFTSMDPDSRGLPVSPVELSSSWKVE